MLDINEVLLLLAGARVGGCVRALSFHTGLPLYIEIDDCARACMRASRMFTYSLTLAWS